METMPERTIRSIIGRQNIVTLPLDTSVRAAAKVMAKHKIGAVPVTELGKLLGIFTERDLMNRIIAKEIDADTTQLRAVMTPDPKTIDVDDKVLHALELMLDGGFRHLPVMQGGRLLGILSIRDIPPEYWDMRETAKAAKAAS